MSDQQPTTTQEGDRQPQTESNSEKRFTQAELDARLEAATKDKLERQRRTFEAQQREAKEALETQALEKQGEFEKLYKQLQKENESLKSRATLAERYEKCVPDYVAKVTEAQPSHIQSLLNKLSIPDQMDWLRENFDSMNAPPVTQGSTNINAWARSANGAPQALTDEEFRAKKRREMPF